MLLLKVINSLSKFFFLFELYKLCWHSGVTLWMISLLRGPRGFGGFVSLKQILEASWILSVVTVFAGSWRWQQESGSWRSGPSALSRECPAVTRSNRPSWASRTVSVAPSVVPKTTIVGVLSTVRWRSLCLWTASCGKQIDRESVGG